jgi:methylmalonyl-CoA epimerase
MTELSDPVNRIHHVGAVVRSLDEARALYQDTLGVRLLKEAVMPDQGVRAALLALDGGLFELLEPIEPETGVARFLESRGEGMHHVCLEVDDIRATLGDLKARGVPLVDEEPREGLTGTIAFLHPSALHGVLVELLDSATAFRPDGSGA